MSPAQPDNADARGTVEVQFTRNVSYAGEEYGPDYDEQVVAVRPDWAAHFVGRGKAVYVEEEESGGESSYTDLTKDELEALAEERELEVEGTGADGNVLKSDLVEALEAADAEA